MSSEDYNTNACAMVAVNSPPLWRASAVTAQSSLAALLFFMLRIAVYSPSRVGGSTQMGGS